MSTDLSLARRTPLAPLTAEVTFARRSILHSVRTPDALVTATMLPVLLMLMFTFVFGGALDSDGRYVDYVVPGIVLLCAGFGAASIAVDVATDITGGVIDRFATMPLRASAVVTGHVVASLVRNLVATGIVLAVGVAVGFRPHADAVDWAMALALVALYVLTITCVFAAVGLVASSPEGAQGLGFILMFAPYVSSAFVPVATMPSWLQPVARYQPITPITETLRHLLFGQPVGAQGWVALAWCIALLSLALLSVGWLFARRSKHR